MQLSDSDIRRFHRHVDRSGDCWLWMRAKDRDGYGWFKLNRQTVYAHRVAYFIANGTLDSRLQVCHKCDNPPCVNPTHLWLGTCADNQRDKSVKGRINGAKNPHARVTESVMRSILDRHTSGESIKDLAAEFGYSRHHLYKVLRGDQWRDLAA